jgi:predicted RNase H-like HicB family nuclease
VKTRGYVLLTLKFQKSGRRWTAYCEELGTATFGRSLPEADQRLKEAIFLHLNTLEDVGEREHFFKEHNIEFHLEKPRDNITICLPVNKEVFVEPFVQAIPALTAA